MCPFLPITTSVRLLITKINQYRLKSASNLILNGHGFYLNSKLHNRRLLAVYYAVNWLGLFSFISFIALNPTLLHWLSFNIRSSSSRFCRRPCLIIYSIIVAFQKASFSESPCLPIWTRATRTPTLTSARYIISPASIACGPGGIWTPDLQIMSLLLSPAELQVRNASFWLLPGSGQPIHYNLFYFTEERKTELPLLNYIFNYLHK